MRITPLARAMRWVSALAETSTMWACPCASKCVSGEPEEEDGADVDMVWKQGGNAALAS
jgi:hypothetical protein